ncbi:hypothetical protein E2562_018661 [Oryza meyeriana var. granulata]|uniref:Uncharacterized protein n=1 Tax=Oryza meyeriana var. granulata TaxID=110450 RepID=A0A6G1BXK6_9ORYZ|nr:hypothetical protein E2562_018661 [Oryza meyeriana var. granulata]
MEECRFWGDEQPQQRSGGGASAEEEEDFGNTFDGSRLGREVRLGGGTEEVFSLRDLAVLGRGVVALQASQAGKGTGKALEDQRGLMPVIAGVSWTEKVRGSRKESLVQPLAAAAKGVMGLLLEENWGRGS